ncbi:MAG: CoA transferase [Trebonia sp.]
MRRTRPGIYHPARRRLALIRTVRRRRLRLLSPGQSRQARVTLDLESEHDRDVLARLAQRSDILIENFRPGTLERLGLGDLRAHNPRLIVISISGFGHTDPLLDGVRVDADALLGNEGDGFAIATHVFDRTRPVIAEIGVTTRRDRSGLWRSPPPWG